MSPTQHVSPTCGAGTQVFEISLPVSQAVCLSLAISRELGRKQSSWDSNGHPCGMPLLQVDTSPEYIQISVYIYVYIDEIFVSVGFPRLCTFIMCISH